MDGFLLMSRDGNLGATLRHIRPDDEAALRDMVRRLSIESRYHRFFSAVSELTPEMLRYLTHVDGHDHVAIVAVTRLGGGSCIVGVARYVRLADPKDVAEAAVAVVDDFQRRGLGTLLLATLADAARRRRVCSFRFEVLRSNIAMRRLLEAHGAKLASERWGELRYEVELGPPLRSPAVHARGE